MKRFLFGLLFCCGILPLAAQNFYPASQEVFGKNRIQTRKFEWKTLRSNNFEFNYYRGGEKLAKDAILIAEEQYDHVTELLGYTPFTTMKVFLYNTPKELKQSNIGLATSAELETGLLNLAKSRVQIAYTGKDDAFKKEIVRQIAHLFVYDMLYGGSVKEILQNQLLLSVPEWYMAGIASYVSEDNSDPLLLDRLRTAVLKNKDKKITYLSGKDAELVGHSIWNYIAMRYGKDNISNILNLTRIIRTEESSITSTLGISYNRFLKEWKEYYTNNLYSTSENKSETDKQLIASQPVESFSTKPKIVLEPGEIDTDNYEFDAANIIKSLATETQKTKQTPETQLPRSPKAKEATKIKGPIAYQNIMVTNQAKVEFQNDPIRRGGLKISQDMNDLLENHLINLSVFVTPTIKNHDINITYKNKAKRIDWGFDVERRSAVFSEFDARNTYLFRPLGINYTPANPINVSRRIYYNRFALNIEYPLNENLRVSISPNAVTTNEVDYDELGKSMLNSALLGYRAETVFDRTKNNHANIMIGTRAKFRLDKYYPLSNTKGFSRMVIDARHYQPIFDLFILAGRISYSSSFGDSPKTTFLGGTENTLIRTIEDTRGQGQGIPRDLRDLFFYDFAGNLRGFNFAKIYGNSHLLTNLELRLPLAQFVSKGSFTSNFVRNLQFVGFTDIGTAWNGKKGPFSRQNSQNTEIIGGGTNSFRAEVTNFRNPFLVGYGVGARTVLLGFIVKLDYARGWEDKQSTKGMTYVSFGHDF